MSRYGKVSIIMPSYNCAAYIAGSIRSVLSQTYEDWELIIVDDCSTDGTEAVIHSFDDPRITFLRNESNRGAAVSRNRALRRATGRWVAFLDSDDLWASEKLERQLEFMVSRGYSFTYTDYRINLNGTWMPYINTAPERVDLRKLYDWCYFSTITVIYDREVVGLVQIADLKKHNDYAMWFQALRKTDAHRLPECLSYYIKHEHSISSAGKLDLVRHHYILYRKGLGKSLALSVLLTANNIAHGLMKKVRYRSRTNEPVPAIMSQPAA